MNVPKTPDHKLIAALRERAKDAPPVDTFRHHTVSASIVSVPLLNEVADRLAELTQPQPTETGRAMPWVRCYGGKILEDNGEEIANDTNGVIACTPDGHNPWLIQLSACTLISPTHWLPCVKVDMATLEGKGDE